LTRRLIMDLVFIVIFKPEYSTVITIRKHGSHASKFHSL
jgi:hypothetical protein